MIKKVESLLRSYKENLSEIQVLTFRLSLNAIDYSKDRVQTSNKSDISDIVVAREKKLIQLKDDVIMVESLLNSLKEDDRKIIEGFYIEGKSLPKIAVEVELTSTRGVWDRKDKILNRLAELYERMI